MYNVRKGKTIKQNHKALQLFMIRACDDVKNKQVLINTLLTLAS